VIAERLGRIGGPDTLHINKMETVLHDVRAWIFVGLLHLGFYLPLITSFLRPYSNVSSACISLIHARRALTSSKGGEALDSLFDGWGQLCGLSARWGTFAAQVCVQAYGRIVLHAAGK